jgi:hypothetical protein
MIIGPSTGNIDEDKKFEYIPTFRIVKNYVEVGLSRQEGSSIRLPGLPMERPHVVDESSPDATPMRVALRLRLGLRKTLRKTNPDRP